MIKFYYFYTPDYEFWNNHLSTTLSGSFDVKPLKQEYIQLSNISHHFLNITLKVELVIDCIKKNKNDYILFTDATIFVNKNNVSLLEIFVKEKIEKNKDMFFVYLEQDPINIGVILLKCDDKVLAFWENVLQRMNDAKTQGIDFHDQSTVIQMLIYEKYPIDYAFFDSDKVWAGGKMPKENCNNFLIYKSTVSPQSNRQLVRLTHLRDLELITEEEYNYWISGFGSIDGETVNMSNVVVSTKPRQKPFKLNFI
jgi:hypothetical protein